MPEPIGGSAPKFASDSESTKITRDVKQTLTLTCSAQGSPVPTFRLVNLGQPVVDYSFAIQSLLVDHCPSLVLLLIV